MVIDTEPAPDTVALPDDARGEETPPRTPPAAGAEQLPLEPRAPAGLARAAIAEQVKALLANAPAVIGGEAGESLHELRIASRRLRAVVKSYEPILPRRPRRAHGAELRALTSALGPAREWDVHAEGLAKERERAGSPEEREALGWLVERVRERAREEHEIMTEKLGEMDLAALVGRTLALPASARRRCDVLSVARETLGALRDEARDEVRRAREDDDVDAMHRARIAAKKLRYALEVLTPAFAAAGAGALAARERAHARAKKIQDVLGKHHDKALLEELVAEGLMRLAALKLEALAEGLLPALGRLVDAQEEKREEFLELTTEGELEEEIDPAIEALG